MDKRPTENAKRVQEPRELGAMQEHTRDVAQCIFYDSILSFEDDW